MKAIHYLIIAVVLLFANIYSLHGQTTEGKEFWLTFGASSFPYDHVDLQIRIASGNTPTIVTIYFTNLDTSVTRSMNANELFTHKLDIVERQAVYNSTMGVTNYSIHITSNEPVSVYALNFHSGSQDATNILPVTALGEEYYQMSYFSIYQDTYAVVATQNNTQVFHNGDSVTTLNVGEVYYRTATLGGSDMTGAHIIADYPVAFFAASRYVTLPFMGGLPGQSPSNLFQQLAPVKTWGKNFFVPATHLPQEVVRILVSQDNTNILVSGGTIQTDVQGAQTSLINLQAGDFVELEISGTGCFIESNNPIGVCAYQSSRLTPGVGSPAQCWIPALKQTVPYARIAAFTSNQMSFFYGHYAMVCTPKGMEDNTKVSVGGAPFADLNGGSWIENTAANMSFYRMPLTNDTATYCFTNSAGLFVLCYADGFSVSYYYLAGSAMRELDAAFYANDVHFQDLRDTAFCAGGAVNFRAEIENMEVDIDSIKWYINGFQETSALNQLVWNKILPIGNYEIKMWVLFENEDTISKTGILKIKNCELDAAFYANNVNLNLKDTVFCNKTVSFITYIERLNTSQDSIKWYIDFGDGFEEHEPALNKKQWNRDFSTGNFPVKMWARLENNVEIEVESILKMNILWIKIRNEVLKK